MKTLTALCILALACSPAAAKHRHHASYYGAAISSNPKYSLLRDEPKADGIFDLGQCARYYPDPLKHDDLCNRQNGPR